MNKLLQETFEAIFNEQLGENFIEILLKKLKQGLTIDQIFKFHQKHPNRSIYRLFGFINDKTNNVHILLK